MQTLKKLLWPAVAVLTLGLLIWGWQVLQESAERSRNKADVEPKLVLQHTSQGHVVGFGKNHVVFGSATHALRITYLGTAGIEPRDEADPLHPEPTAEPTPGPNMPRPLPMGPGGRMMPGFQNANSNQAQPLNRVKYEKMWPRVDVIFTAQPGTITKSEYHLEAGFKPKDIRRIRLGYNRPVALQKDGTLQIKFGLGNMTESAPNAYQVIDNLRVPVKVSFRQLGKQEIGFDLQGYDARYDLVIDPRIIWQKN